MLALLVLLACGTAPTDTADALSEAFGPEVPADPALPPPTSITLDGPDFAMVGRPFQLQVSEALSEETVFVAIGAEPGDGPCRAWLGGYCMGMPAPLHLGGRFVADGAGEATAELMAPPFVGAELCYQAVIRRGPAGLLTAFSEVHCVDFCSEVDSDDDGICDEYDICVGADEVDSDGDGICDAIDPCPADALDTDTDGDGVCDDLDPCPVDAPDDTDGDGVCDSEDICPDDPLDDCSCLPSGGRASFNTLAENSASGCWDGNPCSHDSYSWSDSQGQNFQGFGQAIACSGPTACVSHVGITTYTGSSSVCQGDFDVFCDGVFVGTLSTRGRTCGGSATSNGCNVSFEPMECSSVRLEAVSDGDGTAGCCGGSQPDSMITGVSAW